MIAAQATAVDTTGAAPPCPPPSAAVPHTLYGETMGTRWRVDLHAAAGVDLHGLHAAVQTELDGIVAQMSSWEAGSDISRHARAAAGSWHRLPSPCRDVVACALRIAAESGGAYDPTVSPLVDLWGFGPGGGSGSVPDAAAIAGTLARVGWRRLAWRPGTGELLQPGGVALDLSAIAKGHGVDAVAGCLRRRGIRAALVDVGGELLGFGRKPDGGGWRVLVETDHDGDSPPCVVVLDDCAVATSGDRWHRFAVDGRSYSHTIDPRRGTPVEDAPAAVTVVAANAMDADAWATALTVMGFEAGFAFAASAGMAARFVAHAGGTAAVRSTPAFDAVMV